MLSMERCGQVQSMEESWSYRIVDGIGEVILGLLVNLSCCDIYFLARSVTNGIH